MALIRTFKNKSVKMGIVNATLISISLILLLSFNQKESFITLGFLSFFVFTGLILSLFGLFYSFKEKKKNLVTMTKFILSLALNLLFPLIILFLLAMNLNDLLNFL